MFFIETLRFKAGEGNQLFVYFYGIIFSHKFNIPYIHPGIPSLEIKPTLHLKKSNKYPFKKINHYKEELEKEKIDKNTNYLLDYGFNPTIENYKIFLPYFDFLKKHFNNIHSTTKKMPPTDLVYHLRTGDSLLISNYKYLNGGKLKKLIDKIKHENLYVITNLKKHKKWTMDDLNNYRKFYLKQGDSGSHFKESQLINDEEMKESLQNLNNLITVLNERNAIWISDSILNDFNTIKSFNKIIINVSTFSWWAAILSDAKEVYASKNWKYLKGERNNKLPFVKLETWHAVDF